MSEGAVTAELGDERVIELPQGPIRVYERGEGEPVVFLHGLFANAAAWRKVVPLLAGSHRCITADWPFGSHQLSMAPDADLTPAGIAATIADSLAALDLERVTLVGNDGGGMLAQLVVANHRERIGRLVLTPCDAYENFPPRMFNPLCWAARVPGGVAGFSLLMRFGPVRRAPMAYGWLSHARVPNAILDHYVAGLGDRGVRRDAIKFLRSVSNRYTLDAAQRFGEFDRPVLIAWAEDDRFFPLAHADRFASDFPRARLEVIAGSRTYVAEDQPERLATLIHHFISEAETTTSKERADAVN
jgi:pimeloyl-ACP methyl ester carboxylesterase